MKRLSQFIGMGLLISSLNAPTFAHPGHVLSGAPIAAPEHFFWGMHHLLPVIVAGLLIAALLRYWRGTTTRGNTFRDWLTGRRR